MLELIIQITGARGGIDHVIVNYVISSLLWSVLLGIAVSQLPQVSVDLDKQLIVGAILLLSRELLMIALAVVNSVYPHWHDTLHQIFPPLEHTLQDLGFVCLITRFVHVYQGNSVTAKRYLYFGITSTVITYLCTFWWWADFIGTHTESRFGQTWADWLHHINSSFWILVGFMLLYKRHKQEALQPQVCSALIFLFVCQFLKLPDMAFNETYEHIYTPISRILYLSAILMFIVIAFREKVLLVKSSTFSMTQLLDEQSNRMSIVGHDLRTPISVLKAYLEAFEDGMVEHSAKNYKILHEKLDELNGLIADLSATANLTNEGKLTYQKQPMNIDQLLKSLVTSYQPMLNKSGMQLVFNNLLPSDSVIHADEKRITQLFNNIISNSLKYTEPPGIIKITAAFKRQQLNLIIEDSAPGISTSSIGRIFEPNYRGDPTATSTQEGPGLGLFICRNIVTTHNGTISGAPSTLGGLALSIKLPGICAKI